jgi:hypothetical protein
MILDGTIATADLADGAVTSAKIADATIVAADLASNAVVEAKIASNAVTAGKIKPGTNGQVLTTNSSGATVWAAPATITEVDGIIGNDITDVTTSGGLTRAGSGTAAAPYTVGIATSGVATAMIADKAVTVTKINPGTNGQILTTNSGATAWGTINNGLTSGSGTVQLGGALTKATDIATAGYNLSITGAGNLITGTGKVGVGTTPATSSAKFEVDGAAANKAAYNAGGETTIDFSKSNLAYTTASAGAFTLTNLKDGAAYTLAVRGTTSGTSSFTATNTAASTVNVKIVNSRATVAGSETLYTILVMGTTAYVFVNTGF